MEKDGHNRLMQRSGFSNSTYHIQILKLIQRVSTLRQPSSYIPSPTVQLSREVWSTSSRSLFACAGEIIIMIAWRAFRHHSFLIRAAIK